ncbi:MAG: hypothetical protein WA071_05450 [Undibacterium umbellatum]|uniref:hypothetical protein n=1 Tax=Undibacterium umbellatum TaxID=2762300 RepID=UPI003BB65650
MGMKKISAADQVNIIDCLRSWPRSRALTWETLREALGTKFSVTLDLIWSRQSLSANSEILDAYKKAKIRSKLEKVSVANKVQNESELERKVLLLNEELDALRIKYDNLLLRHTKVIYNASFLEGGTNMLFDTLPDNTRSQGGQF